MSKGDRRLGKPRSKPRCKPNLRNVARTRGQTHDSSQVQANRFPIKASLVTAMARLEVPSVTPSPLTGRLPTESNIGLLRLVKRQEAGWNRSRRSMLPLIVPQRPTVISRFLVWRLIPPSSRHYFPRFLKSEPPSWCPECPDTTAISNRTATAEQASEPRPCYPLNKLTNRSVSPRYLARLDRSANCLAYPLEAVARPVARPVTSPNPATSSNLGQLSRASTHSHALTYPLSNPCSPRLPHTPDRPSTNSHPHTSLSPSVAPRSHNSSSSSNHSNTKKLQDTKPPLNSYPGKQPRQLKRSARTESFSSTSCTGPRASKPPLPPEMVPTIQTTCP